MPVAVGTAFRDDPGFENTIVALELSGQIYSRVARVFFFNVECSHK